MDRWTDERAEKKNERRNLSSSLTVLLPHWLAASIAISTPTILHRSFFHPSSTTTCIFCGCQLFMTLDKRNCIIRIACCTSDLVSLWTFWYVRVFSLLFFHRSDCRWCWHCCCCHRCYCCCLCWLWLWLPFGLTYLPLIQNEFSLDSFVYDLPCLISVSHTLSSSSSSFGVQFCK